MLYPIHVQLVSTVCCYPWSPAARSAGCSVIIIFVTIAYHCCTIVNMIIMCYYCLLRCSFMLYVVCLCCLLLFDVNLFISLVASRTVRRMPRKETSINKYMCIIYIYIYQYKYVYMYIYIYI